MHKQKPVFYERKSTSERSGFFVGKNIICAPRHILICISLVILIHMAESQFEEAIKEAKKENRIRYHGAPKVIGSKEAYAEYLQKKQERLPNAPDPFANEKERQTYLEGIRQELKSLTSSASGFRSGNDKGIEAVIKVADRNSRINPQSPKAIIVPQLPAKTIEVPEVPKAPGTYQKSHHHKRKSLVPA